MTTLLHVGFHKTGTKTLQQVFFPALPDCVVVGPNNPGFEEFHPLIHELAEVKDLDYSDDAIRGFLDRMRGNATSLVVTHEDLSVLHADGRTAARLHALLPDTKVLICVREQQSMLTARYGGYVKKGGTQTFTQFTNRMDPDWFRYDLVVHDYQEQFGRERVLVMPFERLVRDPARYFAEVQRFAVGEEVPSTTAGVAPLVNRTLAPPTRWVVLQCNRLFVVSEENPRPPLRRLTVGAKAAHRLQKLDPVWFSKMKRQLGRRDRARAERIAKEYAHANSRLECLTGLSLREYGYVLEDPAPPTNGS